MSVWEALLIIVAGVGAGTINTIVGSGTLITFPTLLFLGYPPLAANVSNTVGLVAGGITGIFGYRRELKGTGSTLRRLVPMSVVGGITGALLLLVLPSEAFAAIVPALIALGVLLVIFGPALQQRANSRHTDAVVAWHVPALLIGLFVAGVYGGYFGAAQGVILMGLLSSLSAEPLQRLNGFKNVLGTLVNGVAAIVFVIGPGDQIRWGVAGLIAIGAFIGGWLGSSIGRRLAARRLRVIIVLIGVVGIVKIVWFP